TLSIWCPERWPLSAAQVGLLALTAAWCLVAAARGAVVRFGPGAALLASAIAWAALTTFLGWTVYPFASYSALLHWIVIAAIYLICLQLFTDDRLRHAFLHAFLLFGLAVAVLAVIQFPTSGGRFLWLLDSPYPDLLGPFQNRSNFAAFVELLVPLALWHAIRDPRHRFIYLGITAALVASVAASSSRAGTVLVLLEVAAVFLLVWKHEMAARPRLIRGAAIASAMIVVGAFIADWSLLLRRLTESDPLGYRPEIFESTFAMIAAKPWTGFGLGTFPNVYPAFALFDIGQLVNHAHNDWLEWAAEGGIPLVLLLAAFVAWSLPGAIRSVWGLGVVAVFIHALVDYPLQRLGVAGWVFVMLAAVAASRSRRENRLT
ncbi:MAG: O-antigen ligase family protein, partial [bacterium]|nr:O-antigen ligase family protein [bacterium]